MTTSQKPPSAQSTLARGPTPDTVFTMFSEFNLHVCDDEKEILEAVQKKQSYIAGLEKTPGPENKDRVELLRKYADTLKRSQPSTAALSRPAILEVVFNQFVDLADSACSALIEAGKTKVSSEFNASLLAVALYKGKDGKHRVDAKLAEQWVKEYKKLRGLKDGKDLLKVDPPTSFSAQSGKASVQLHWTLQAPTGATVIITRSEEGSKNSVDIYRAAAGAEKSFADVRAPMGRWCVYDIVLEYKKTRSSPRSSTGVRWGEVTSADAKWDGGRMRLSWSPPAANTSVHIFRRTGAAPTVKIVGGAPVPGDSATTKVYQGASQSWEDQSVRAGEIHHYLIVCDYGRGIVSDGVLVQEAVPESLPCVAKLDAHYARADDQEVVTLRWPALQTKNPVTYVVRRTEGAAAPAGPDQGTPIAETEQTQWADAQVLPGRRYRYAVFARAGDRVSPSGAAAGPVDILADVKNVKIQAADQVVEILWRPPANGVHVVVRRSLNPPRDANDGVLVPLAGSTLARDEGLQNGRQYHYLICCAYRPDGGHEAFSPGVRASATPHRLPEYISDFRVECRGASIQCDWTAPASGRAVVVRTQTPLPYTPGRHLTMGELPRPLEIVPLAAPNCAVDNSPALEKPYYSLLTVGGTHAIFCGSAVCVAYPDVKQLRASATNEGVALRWIWPEGCRSVRILRRSDKPPENSTDPAAIGINYSRTEYEQAGNRWVDVLQGRRGQYFYTVYAQAPNAPGALLSQGIDDECKVDIFWRPPMTLRYGFAANGREAKQKSNLVLKWKAEKSFPEFGGFVVMASDKNIPASERDGIELARWTPENGIPEGENRLLISLKPIQERRWPQFFCKAFVVDLAQSATVLMVHPDVTKRISADGSVETEKFLVENGYSTGVPKTFICPSCFTEFAVGEMLFADQDGAGSQSQDDSSSFKKGRIPLWSQLSGSPKIVPPRGATGRKLTQKICPKPDCHKNLPRTAGLKPSLMVGLMGAFRAGKTQYVASLISQLRDRAGADMDASLVHITQETEDRYRREFGDQLIRRTDVPKTVGTPPPLLYDLRFDRKLWGEKADRSVTLALCDTAGESFNSEQEVREFVHYLKVSSGTILMIDPLQFPKVREFLSGSFDLPDFDPMAEPNALISRTLDELEKKLVLAPNQRLPIPIAVVLTKCDVLRDAGIIDCNRVWNTEAHHVRAFDRVIHDDMSGMMGEFMQKWCPGAYNTIRLRFDHYSFFGVSATGCALDKKTGRYGFIAPWRVEDPLFWILAKLGVIPTR